MKASVKRSQQSFKVMVEVSRTVMHMVPVMAEDKEHARHRAERIVKAGNTRAVGGKRGDELFSVQAVKIERRR